jgi:hypothetical protein
VRGWRATAMLSKEAAIAGALKISIGELAGM